ncbi:MAG: hypothetical protein RIS83_2354, partial [Pseudomonadota bacterium]
DIPVQIKPVPTIRETDGLAMSSRNRFLQAAERATAPILYQVMQATAQAITAGGSVASLLAEGQAKLAKAGLLPEYFALVAAETLQPLAAPDRSAPMRLLAAAKLGTVRLLDNMPVEG